MAYEIDVPNIFQLNPQILQVFWAYAALGAVAAIREDYSDIEVGFFFSVLFSFIAFNQLTDLTLL